MTNWMDGWVDEWKLSVDDKAVLHIKYMSDRDRGVPVGTERRPGGLWGEKGMRRCDKVF